MNNELYQDKYRRGSHRLKRYDYSQPGWYFITICTFHNKCIFGKVENNEMCLNKFGQIVQKEWKKSGEIRTEIEVDEFVIMPNHFHALIGIDCINYKQQEKVVNNITQHYMPKSVATLICGFKSSVTSKIRKLVNDKKFQVWQKNYYDHIVRKSESVERIRNYIFNNSLNWNKDKYYM